MSMDAYRKNRRNGALLPAKAKRSTTPRKAKASEPAVNPLRTVIVPAARDRWRGARISHYTPDLIETTLAGAFTGDLRAQWDLFDLMEETWPRLSKALNELKRAAIGLEWNLQPWAEKGEEPGDDAVAKAKFCEGLLWTMRPQPTRNENDFEGTLYDVLDAWGKGISILEIDWEQRAAGNAIAPRCTRWIHPRYYGYPFDAEELMLNVTELQTSAAFAGRPRSDMPRTEFLMGGRADWLPFPENKFIIAVAKQRTGHPIGGAMLRTLAWWWVVSNFTAEWMLNFAQIFGQPLRWANYDPGRPEIFNDLQDMMENLGSSGWGIFPAGTQIEFKEATKNGQDNPQTHLQEFADKQVDLLLLHQTLTTDVGDSGSRALGDVHQDVLSDTVQGMAEWAATTVNQFLRAICRLNYGNDRECPWFAPTRKEVKDAKSLAERDQILLNSGVPLPRQWFYERHDVPVPSDGEETIQGNRQSGLPDLGLGGSRFDGYTQLSAKAAQVETTESVLRLAVADAVGAREKSLAPLSKEIDRLARLAKSGKLSDAEFTTFIERAAKSLPELFTDLKPDTLADSIEAALGTAVLEGVRDDVAAT